MKKKRKEKNLAGFFRGGDYKKIKKKRKEKNLWEFNFWWGIIKNEKEKKRKKFVLEPRLAANWSPCQLVFSNFFVMRCTCGTLR